MSTLQVPVADLAEARRFLELLDEEAESFCFQVFDDSPAKRPELARTLHGSLNELWPTLVKLNQAGAGVFVAINSIEPGKPRRNENVTGIRAGFADFDSEAWRGAQYPLPPLIEVESSPGKRHVYWPVTGMPVDRFRPVQKAIAATFGSDPVVSDPARVMRLPGTVHRKNPDRPHVVRVVNSEPAQPYTAARIQEAFPTPVPETPAPAANVGRTNRATTADIGKARKIAFDAARRTHDDPRSSRHAEIVKMGHHLRRDGVSLSRRIGKLVLDTFEEHMRPTDAGGNPAPMNRTGAAKALREAYNKPSEPDRVRRQIPPPPGPSVQSEWERPGPVGGTSNLPECPVDQLPPVAEDAVAEYWAYGKQPLALLCSCCLGALSLAAQGLADVARDEILSGPISLYLLSVGDSGERKSAADRVFGLPGREWEKSEAEAREAEIRGNRGRRASWRAQMEGIRTKIKSTAGKEGDEARQEVRRLEVELERLEQDEPPLMPKPRLLFEELTQQGLTFDLATGYQSAGIFSDEGGIVLGSAALREESATGFQGVLNRLWDGSAYRETRKSVEAAEIVGRRLTVSIMIQHHLLQQMMDKGARGIGFLARCLIAAPASTMGQRPYSLPPSGTPDMSALHARLRELLDTPLPLDHKGRLDPPMMTLEPQAKRVWIAHHDRIERELGAFGEYAGVRDFGAKSAENAVRLAALFQILTDGPGGTIGVDTMRRGVALAGWYLESARNLFFDVSKPQEVRDAEQLSAWLVGVAPTLEDRDGHPLMVDGALPTRVILNRGPNPLRDKARRDAALIVLADPDVGHVHTFKNGNKMLVQVNPYLLGRNACDVA